VRILFAVLSPISAELGAAQVALNLARALRAMGIEAVIWTPYPIPPEVLWWRRMTWVRRKIAEYVRRDGKFDVVDVPPVAVTRLLARQCTVVARSVQPDLHYLWTEVRYARRVHPLSLGVWIASAMFNAYLAALVLAGWFRARYILCLGSLDYDWMTRWFPWWRRKLALYFNAVGDEERDALAKVRRNRIPSSRPGTRFVWLGRWAAHKGRDLLIKFMKQRLEQCPQDRVTIAGCGTEVEKHLPPFLLQCGKIHIVPAYERRDLPKLLAEHDVGLFTSYVEGWGLTLQEMLESGMPVYATNAGAVADLRAEFPELVREFPPGIGEKIEIPNSSLVSTAYLKRFSWSVIAAGYLENIRGKA